MSTILKLKYDKALELYEDMSRPLPHKRPNCAEILLRRHLWAMFENEIEINNDLKIIIESLNCGEKFSIYSLLKLKKNL